MTRFIIYNIPVSGVGTALAVCFFLNFLFRGFG